MFPNTHRIPYHVDLPQARFACGYLDFVQSEARFTVSRTLRIVFVVVICLKCRRNEIGKMKDIFEVRLRLLTLFIMIVFHNELEIQYLWMHGIACDHVAAWLTYPAFICAIRVWCILMTCVRCQKHCVLAMTWDCMSAQRCVCMFLVVCATRFRETRGP